MQISEHLPVNKNALNYFSNYLLLAVNKFQQAKLCTKKSQTYVTWTCCLNTHFNRVVIIAKSSQLLAYITIVPQQVFFTQCCRKQFKGEGQDVSKFLTSIKRDSGYIYVLQM